MRDLAERFEDGEAADDLVEDLHYGLMAEVEEFVSELLARLQSACEGDMSYTCTNRLSNSPEPATLRPS